MGASSRSCKIENLRFETSTFEFIKKHGEKKEETNEKCSFPATCLCKGEGKK